jgi:hypothetical protein
MKRADLIVFSLIVVGVVGCGHDQRAKPNPDSNSDAVAAVRQADCNTLTTMKEPTELLALEEFHLKTASCALDAGRLDQAERALLALPAPADQRSYFSLRARLGARRDDALSTAGALQSLATAGGDCAAASKDRAIQPMLAHPAVFATAVWCGERGGYGDDYVADLATRRGKPLVSARAVAADPGLRSGRTVNWVGVVERARVNREKKVTVFELIGVDVVPRQIGSKQVADGRHEEHTFSGSYMVTDFREVRVFEEQFIPNGVRFIAYLPDIREPLLDARSVRVIGDLAPSADGAVVTTSFSGAGSPPETTVHVAASWVSVREPRTFEQ